MAPEAFLLPCKMGLSLLGSGAKGKGLVTFVFTLVVHRRVAVLAVLAVGWGFTALQFSVGLVRV